MNINLIEHLAKTVTPSLLGAAADKSESSLLNQLFAIFLGRFTEDGVTSKVFDAYNKLTSNGSINPADISADSLSSLSSLVWKDDEQADTVVKNLAENHGVGLGKVKGLAASALPLVLGQLKGVAGDTPVAQFLREQPTDQEGSFTNYIPNWALAMLPAGLLGAGAVAAKAVTSQKEDTKPAYATSSTTTSTTVTKNEKEGGGFLKGLLPLLGLLIAGLLAWTLLKGCPKNDAADTTAAVEHTEEHAEGEAHDHAEGEHAEGEGVVDTATGVVADGAEAATDAAGNVVEGATDAAGAVADGATDAAGAVVDGAAAGAGAVVDALTGGADAAKDGAAAAAGALAGMFSNPEDQAMAEELNMQIVHFSTNKDGIPADNQAKLDKAVEVMNKLTGAKLQVTGYTDTRGDDAYNQKLSEERANAVKDYLVGQGVAADRITTVGAGETTQFSAETTEEGLYENRRITFAVSK